MGKATESPYGAPVQTLAELETLDSAEMVEGYSDGLDNCPAPNGNRSKAYWHGWRNGMVDGSHMEPDAAMSILARLFINTPKETPDAR